MNTDEKSKKKVDVLAVRNVAEKNMDKNFYDALKKIYIKPNYINCKHYDNDLFLEMRKTLKTLLKKVKGFDGKKVVCNHCKKNLAKNKCPYKCIKCDWSWLCKDCGLYFNTNRISRAHRALQEGLNANGGDEDGGEKDGDKDGDEKENEILGI